MYTKIRVVTFLGCLFVHAHMMASHLQKQDQEYVQKVEAFNCASKISLSVVRSLITHIELDIHTGQMWQKHFNDLQAVLLLISDLETQGQDLLKSRREG